MTNQHQHHDEQHDEAKKERVEKQATQDCGFFELKVEGLSDGYRITVKGDADEIKQQRRVAASFVNFVRQADKAGFYLPWPFRMLLGFWAKYK